VKIRTEQRLKWTMAWITSMEFNIQTDTEDNSSFLNEGKLKVLQTAVDKCRDELQQNKKKRDILQRIRKFLTFKKVFSTQGLQGITGMLTMKDPAEDIVFKIALELDRSVEHENLVTRDLNSLRPYCPHFVGNIGMINMPVSNDFINEPDSETLFKNNNDYFPCNVLLIEYVSPISLYHICKHLPHDKNVIISLLAQIMIALDIAQTKRKFTSYDLHLENILIRRVEEDTIFLYVHKGKSWLIPTFGFYPVIIDLGSSYVKSIEGNPMYTSIDNYHYGLQPTIYDNLNDVHHLLISVLGYLSDKGYVYDHLHTRFLHLFRHVPVLSERGWKKLPHDLFDLVLKQMRDDCPSVDDFPIFAKYDTELVHLLNGLIILPWMEEKDTSFKDCLEPFLSEVQKIHDMKSVQCTDDILYIIRETIESINNFRQQYEQDKKTTLKLFVADWKQRIGFIIHNNAKEIPRDLDFDVLFGSALKVAERLSSNYYKYVQDHCELISGAYLKTNLRGPIDAAKILLQNATPRVSLTTQSKIYIWNADEEKKTVVCMKDLGTDILAQVNDTPFFKKGEALLRYFNK
jgi:hypothetical protein